MPQESNPIHPLHPADVPLEMPVAEALEHLSGKQADEQEDFLHLNKHGQPWVVQQVDLQKMVAMDLGMLPVDSIAIPKASPLFQNRYQELTATLDLSRQLTKFFPTHFVAALYEIQSLLGRAGVQGYVVGGIPRDLLLYQQKRFELEDVDITVEGDAIEMGRFLTNNSRNFCLAEEFPEFGTVKLYYKDNLILDIASTRKEVYPFSGALPDVLSRGVPLAEDIIRRDFTINALAFSILELGRILDYTNGIQDIESRCIRVLHPVSFYEDPSRILRALKFAVRLNFQLADETQALLEQFLQYGAMVYKGGGERIKYELKSFLRARYQDRYAEPADAEVLKLHWTRFFLQKNCLQLANMELIRRIPEERIEQLVEIARLLPKLQQELEQYVYYDFVFDVFLCFILSDLPEEEFETTVHRLGLTRPQREAVETYMKLLEKQSFTKLKEFSSATEIYQIFHHLPLATVAAGIIHARLTENKARYKILLDAYKTYKRKWEHIKLELDGNDLLALGVPQGKAVGDMLKQLLNAKLSGRVPDRMAEIRLAKNLMAQSSESTQPEPT